MDFINIQHGFVRIGKMLIRKSEIIAVSVSKEGEEYQALIWQQGKTITDQPLFVAISKEDYDDYLSGLEITGLTGRTGKGLMVTGDAVITKSHESSQENPPSTE